MMSVLIFRRFFVATVIILVLPCSTFASKDLYSILGVRRNASPSEIKKAYKELVKYWHPDKNKDPDAEGHFIDINRAYGILNDPDRRAQYDRYGGLDEDVEKEAPGERNPFADFHFGSFGDFQYQFHSTPNFFKKHDIGLRVYENSLVNKSHNKPYLIFVYADWCASCMQAEQLWEYVVSELEPDGYGIATINSKLEGALIDKLRVRQLPAVIALVDGRPLHYRGQTITAKGLFEFASQILSKSMVTLLNDINYRNFLEENWRRNKMSAIFCGTDEEPSMRLLLAAMRYRTMFAFGYISANTTATMEFRAVYGILSARAAMAQTLLVFNERINAPLITLQEEDISAMSINSILDRNKYLILPRLSSPAYFNELCPPAKQNARFCALLLVQAANSKADDGHVTGFRDLLADRHRDNDDVRFVYVYEDRQKEFVESLSLADPERQAGTVVGDRRHVVVLWRTGQQRAKVQWLRYIWSGNPETVNRSTDLVLAKVESITRKRDGGQSRIASMQEISLKPLIDEDSPTVYKRLASKLVRSWDSFLHHVGKDEFLPAISILGTLAFMIMVGYCLNHIADTEKKAENERKSRRDRGKPIEETKEFKTLIRELRAETYFGMVRMLKPGFRSIIILVDAESKDVLVNQFARAIWPWRKNKTLLFGFVMVEKNLDWFLQLLEAALADPGLRLKQGINPRNVVGTVLSLNGFRQFFCMYHPKHAPSMAGFKAVERRRMQDSRHFLGFESADTSDENVDDDSDEDEMKSKHGDDNAKEFLKTKVLKVDELLDGFPNWLERLFRGNARRYFIAEWPPIR